jgi:hypothetical protein
MFNYIIESRKFPDIWAVGLRTPVPKPGDSSNVDNYRGITVLSVFAKIFEITINKRLSVINEVFGRTDRTNGGFLKGSQTSDNLFILNGLVEKQLILGKKLVVCFVDFSKAFDLINRHILFYKLMSSGIHGRVIDTIRDLYKKTCFHVKTKDGLSQLISDTVGVNQGGNLSPTLFRQYIADLGKYLHRQCGIVVGEEILTHILWADDLILISDSESGIQKQLDGLFDFCSANHMIVNEMKTKVMHFGPKNKVIVKFNGKIIQQVDQYKYLGNIISSITNSRGDIFKENYKYLSDKGRKATFAMHQKLKPFGKLPPNILLHVYDALVKPILVYGSEVWGLTKHGTNILDRVFLGFLKKTIRVKISTSNYIVYGETGKVPLGVLCNSNALSYFIRAQSVPDNMLVKKVFLELKRLHEAGFKTWFSRVCDLGQTYNLDVLNTSFNFKSGKIYKVLVTNKYKEHWAEGIKDIERNPILRLYSNIKFNFGLENYLLLVKDYRWRNAITKLRSSSHALEIEKGRHTRPMTPLNSRICKLCDQETIETEMHFLMHCTFYLEARNALFDKIQALYPGFKNIPIEDQFYYMLTNDCPKVLTWLGKYIYKCFNTRNTANTTKHG